MKQGNTVAAKLWAAGLMLMAAGCGRGHTLVGSLLLNPPVITDTLPDTVKGPGLLVHGTRDPGTQVYIVFAGSKNGALLADTGSDSTWSGTVNLSQGDNTFALYEVKGSLESSNSNDYKLGRVPLPPGVNAPAAYTVAQSPATVPGTKEAGTGVYMTDQNQVVTQVWPTDNGTTWSTHVNIVNGNNTVSFVAKNSKYTSDSVSATIFGSPLSAPLLLCTSPTNNPTQTISIFRNSPVEQATVVDLVIDSNQPVVAASPSTSGSSSSTYPVTLAGDGNHVLTAYEIDQNTQLPGPSSTCTIALKTTVPAKPTITSSFGDVGNANYIITGSTDAGSYVCVATTSGGPCVTQGPAAGGTFSVSTTLSPGSNTVYITARDGYGNVSQEVAGTVYLISPPQISNESPSNGNTLGPALAFVASVTAIPSPSDNVTSHPTAAISFVMMSLDGGASARATSPNSTFSESFSLPAGTSDGSSHTLTFTAQNGVGEQVTFTSNFIYSDGSAVWVSKDPSHYSDEYPTSALDGNGTLHVFWDSACALGTSPACPWVTGGNPPDILYSQRSNKGVWSTVVAASSTDGSMDGVSQTPVTAVDANGRVHVLWTEGGPINKKNQGTGIVHRIYTPSTNTWSSIIPVSSASSPNDLSPSIAIDKAAGIVHAAWSRQTTTSRSDIIYARYVAGAWSAELAVTSAATDPNQGTASVPNIAVAAGGTAQIVWSQCELSPSNTCVTATRNYDVYLRTVKSATTLGNLSLVSNGTKGTIDGDSGNPVIAVDSNNLAWIYWTDTSGYAGNGKSRNVYMRNYDPNGVPTTSQYTTISTDPSVSGPASGPIAVTLGPTVAGAQLLAVAWGQDDGSGVQNIAARIGDNNANLAVKTYYASPAPVVATNPTIALDASSQLYVTWGDYRNYSSPTDQAEQIYFLPVTPN